MKTPVVIALASSIVMLGALAAFLYYTDRDPLPFFIALATIIPVLANVFQTQKVDKQTNGTNAELRAKNAAQAIEISALRTVLTPDQAAAVPILTVPTEGEAVVPSSER